MPATNSACAEPAPLSSEETDDVLMEAFCSGDSAAFDVLFDRYGTVIHRHLTRLCRDPVAAADLTQSTFLSVVRARDRFEKGSSFRKWVFVIAMNGWRDYRRVSGREVASDPVALEDVASEGAPPDPFLERLVREALRALPVDQREAVLLHQIEGFSFKEIGEMVGVGESAVKVRAHRGYERLRALLQETWSSR